MAERFLTRAQVQERCGIARMTVYRLMGAGTFPRPVKIGPRANRWPESEIETWMAAKMAARPEGTAPGGAVPAS